MKSRIASSIMLLLPMLLVNKAALAHESPSVAIMHSFEHMLADDPASIFAILVFMLIIVGIVKTGGNLAKTKKDLAAND